MEFCFIFFSFRKHRKEGQVPIKGNPPSLVHLSGSFHCKVVHVKVSKETVVLKKDTQVEFQTAAVSVWLCLVNKMPRP